MKALYTSNNATTLSKIIIFIEAEYKKTCEWISSILHVLHGVLHHVKFQYLHRRAEVEHIEQLNLE